MDFKQFWLVLRRRWIIIGVLVGLAVLVSGLLSIRATPQYESKARIFISVDVSNITDASSAQFFLSGRIKSYADLATSTDLLDQVIGDLNLPVTTAQLADRIEAEVVPETTLIQITVKDPDPKQAQAIARLESQRLTEYLRGLETPSGRNETQIVARVTDAASYDPEAVTPRTMLNIIVAGLIGLLMGVTAALARELLDRTVRSMEHVQELTESPILASIGHDASIKKTPLLTDLGNFAARTEAFRLLRTNLQFLDLDQRPRCIVITSAVPGEGKTMTATNLAVAVAQTGRKTLLIDGDLRRPRVAKLLGLDPAVGLTTVLIGRSDVQDAIQVHEPSGLHLLASGAKPPNPTEILQSKVTQDLILSLADDYDMVIIDAPPLLPVADAAVISTIADGVILVVKHGDTSRDALDEGLKRLKNVGGRLFGVVVNQIPKRSTGNYYYYYYEESGGGGSLPADPDPEPVAATDT